MYISVVEAPTAAAAHTSIRRGSQASLAPTKELLRWRPCGMRRGECDSQQEVIHINNFCRLEMSPSPAIAAGIHSTVADDNGEARAKQGERGAIQNNHSRTQQRSHRGSLSRKRAERALAGWRRVQCSAMLAKCLFQVVFRHACIYVLLSFPFVSKYGLRPPRAKGREHQQCSRGALPFPVIVRFSD